MAEYLKVEDWYLRKAIDKNVANIVNKAREQRPFVEQLLFTEEKIPFDINREAIRFLHTHGLLQDDGEGHVTFWVPLYKKCLYQAFYPYTNGETKQITQQLTPWEYFDEAGKLRMDRVIEAYQAYVKRRSFKYFREKDAEGKYVSIKEAALMYSFETFMQAFLLACGGKSYLEPHTGPGRADLILNIEGREYVVEAKIYRYPRQFEQGKGQLANYLRSLGQPEGWYLVFVPNHLDLQRLRLSGGTETHEGVAIHTTLLLYDEEKDF